MGPIFWPGVTLLALLITVGVSLLIAGATQAGQSWQLRGRAHGWGWSFAVGPSPADPMGHWGWWSSRRHPGRDAPYPA